MYYVYMVKKSKYTFIFRVCDVFVFPGRDVTCYTLHVWYLRVKLVTIIVSPDTSQVTRALCVGEMTRHV